MTKRFWVPYAPYDVESIKMWLEEKAEEGYRLKKMKPYFAVFEETDREKLKFHLEPTLKDANKPDDDIVKTRGERGWTYAGTLTDHFHVFYADAVTPEFYSDQHAVKWKYEEKLKKERRSILWTIPAFMLVVLLEMGAIYGMRQPILWVIESLKMYHLLYLSFLFLGFFAKLLTYRRHKKYVEHLEEKDDYYTPSTGTFRMVNLIGTGLFMLATIGILFQTFSSDNDSYEYQTLNDLGKDPAITLLDLEKLRDPDLEDINNIEFIDYAYRDESLLLNEKIRLHQSTDLVHRPSLTTTYYTAKSEGIMNVLEEELIKQSIENTGDTDSVKEVYSGVSVSYFDVPQLRTMILCHEDRLIKLEYRGRLDLKDWKVLMAEKFLKSIENPDGV